MKRAGCCATSPALIYRSQSAPFSGCPESYNGGIRGACTNTGAIATQQSYFWTVE